VAETVSAQRFYAFILFTVALAQGRAWLRRCGVTDMAVAGLIEAMGEGVSGRV
jgi:hypothetical protein